jgi:hypothetical protein
MASQVDIANLALSILGKPSIASFTDNSNTARIINIEYDLLRKGMQEGPGTWRFTVLRTSLPALTNKPASGPFQQQFALPSDYIRPLQIGDTYAGLDMSDYRQGPTDADWSIENGILLCDYGSPVSFQYVADTTNTTLFNPNFVIALAAQLAWTCCERLTGSDAKQKAAEDRKDKAYRDAAASNAFMSPPGHNADSEWLVCRMGNA